MQSPWFARQIRAASVRPEVNTIPKENREPSWKQSVAQGLTWIYNLQPSFIVGLAAARLRFV